MKKFLCFFILTCCLFISSTAQYVQVDNTCGFSLSGTRYKPLVCNYGISFLQDNAGVWYISPEQGYSANWSSPDAQNMFDSNSANHVNGATNVTLSKAKLINDLARIRSLGFTEIRLVGADYKIGIYGDINPANGNGYPGGRSSTYFSLMDNFLGQVDAAGLKVIYVLGGLYGDNDFTNNTAFKTYIKTVATHYASNTAGRAIMAYDLNNEPGNFLHLSVLNDKYNFAKLYSEWANCIKSVDQNHLITIGFFGMNEVLSNDPTLLPIDFVSFHVYLGPDPARHNLVTAKNIMNTYYYWSGKTMTMPWIIGETSYPACDAPYSGASMGTEATQKLFTDYVLKLSVDCNCKGFSWWKYQNTSWGDAYEDYMGVYNRYSGTTDGTAKPVAASFPAYAGMMQVKGNCPMPSDYYTVYNGTSTVLTGKVKDNFGNNLANAVVTAFDNTWTVTFTAITDANGDFTIKTNGLPLGTFSIAFPGYSTLAPPFPFTNGATYILNKVNYNSWVKEWTNSDMSGTLNYGTSTSNWSLSIYDKFYKGDFNADGRQDLLCVKYSGSSSTTDRMTILTYTNSFSTVSWTGGSPGVGRPISNISAGWKLLWDNGSNPSNGGGIYPYRNDLVIGDFDGNGSDDVLGIGSGVWTTWFTFVPNANPALATWAWQDSNYGTVNDPAHPMSYMTPYTYNVIAGNFYLPNQDAIIGCLPSGNWVTSFQLVGGTWTWGQSSYGQSNDPTVGNELSYLCPYKGSLRTGDFDGDGITDILGGTSTGPYAYLKPVWNPVNSNHQWQVKWSGTSAILSSYNYRMVVGNFDSDNSDEIFGYNSSGTCAHINFNASYAPYFDGSGISLISDWSTGLVTAYTNYVFLKTDENSKQEQLLCLRSPNAAMYAFRPNVQTQTPCSTLRLASTEEESGQKTAGVKNDGLSVYPNPGTGVFLVSLAQPIDKSTYSISLFDIEGREIKDYTVDYVDDLSFDVKLNNPKAGIYFLRVVNNKVSYSKKIMVF